MMICKSMKSKGYLKEVFAWQYQYFTLTLDGIRALCDHLGLSSNVRPDIYKQTGSRRQNMERGPRRNFGRGQPRAPKQETSE